MTELDILLRTVAAMICGALIGVERSYRGRAAGMRTYGLVCMGACLLVACVEYAAAWSARGSGDPTRVIQGIVTGIGFLGAGVIMREGFSVHGLTTAASIWTIAVIGVVFGTGLYAVAAIGTAATWIALEVLQVLESRIPARSLVHCSVAFQRANAWSEAQLGAFVERHGFTIDEASHSLDSASQVLTYELAMWSRDADASTRLTQALLADAAVLAFRVTPARD